MHRKAILIFKSIYFVICFLLLFFTNISYAQQTCVIDELNMKVNLPSEYTVITKTTAPKGLMQIPEFKSKIIKLQSSEGFYLVGINDDFTKEIFVNSPALNPPLPNPSDTDLKNMEKYMVNSFEKMGVTVLDHSIYDSGVKKYATITYQNKADGTISEFIRYSTISNGRVINITMSHDSGKLSIDDKSVIKKVIDNTSIADAKPNISEKTFSNDLKEYHLYKPSVGAAALLLVGIIIIILQQIKKHLSRKNNH